MNKCREGNTSFRIAQQFTEIVAFKFKYAQNYQQERIYESLLLRSIFFMFFANEQIRISKVITPKEKKELYKKLSFPLSLKEVLKLKRKKLCFLQHFFLSRMPYRDVMIKFILELSTLKKKWL
ncbi:MAG: hypothetical protein FWC34_07245 [Bacteroidetes bacterium]|nr:hypothetical protein [Bacteroidota bacterium]